MTDRPNVVRIVAHDAGQHVGCYGIDTVDTPELDRLAAEGVRFENSFCVAPQCSPSRASMVTGRYPHSNGVMGLAHGRFAWELDAEERHVAALLSEAGWHSVLAGTHHATRDDDAFDDVLVDGGPAERVSAAATEAIHEYAGDADDGPLSLQVGFFEPHRRPGDPGAFPTPAVPDEYGEATLPAYLLDEPSARDELRAFEAAVERMDAGVGCLLDALDEAGVAENTVVIATTDHGIPFPRAKCSPYDPGLETFLLLRWPQRLPAGDDHARSAGTRACVPPAGRTVRPRRRPPRDREPRGGARTRRDPGGAARSAPRVDARDGRPSPRRDSRPSHARGGPRLAGVRYPRRSGRSVTDDRRSTTRER